MSNTTEVEESKLEHYFLSMYLVMAFILSLVGNSVVLYSSVSIYKKKDEKQILLWRGTFTRFTSVLRHAQKLTSKIHIICYVECFLKTVLYSFYCASQNYKLEILHL